MAGAPIDAPIALETSHEVAAFRSCADELDEWLHEYAWVNHASGNARVFVAARERVVVGYYTLSTAGVAEQKAPDEIKKGGVPKDVSSILLGRMAVHADEQDRHLGSSLLTDALLRIARLSGDVGVRALLIHARDESARSWYLHQARTFVSSPTDPLHLFLSIKELRRIATELD